MISLGATAKHLRQILTAAAPFFMTTTATAGLNLDDRLIAIHRANDGADSTHFLTHAYQRRSGAVSSNGRSFAATASRARKIRERTVPIGQSMMAAISS